MRQIAGKARLTTAAIYNHFRGKEAIFLALLAERVPQRAIIRALAATQGETVQDLVHDALNRMNATMADQYDNMRLLFIELLEFQGRHARAVAHEFLPQALAFIGRLRSASGNLRSLEPLIMARALLGLFMSYVITETFFPKIPGFESRPSDLRDLAEVFLHGVLGPSGTDRPGPRAGSGSSPRAHR
jgi:AcrR family transcriptional regulator